MEEPRTTNQKESLQLPDIPGTHISFNDIVSVAQSDFEMPLLSYNTFTEELASDRVDSKWLLACIRELDADGADPEVRSRVITLALIVGRVANSAQDRLKLERMGLYTESELNAPAAPTLTPTFFNLNI